MTQQEMIKYMYDLDTFVRQGRQLQQSEQHTQLKEGSQRYLEQQIQQAGSEFIRFAQQHLDAAHQYQKSPPAPPLSFGQLAEMARTIDGKAYQNLYRQENRPPRTKDDRARVYDERTR